jgi:outer membrane protein OmpA-like peptidoglycan-associated protein
MIRIYFVVISVFIGATVFAQKNEPVHSIKPPSQKKCEDYGYIYKRLPVELRYSTFVADRVIYFYFPSSRYLNLLFDKKKDGIAIDIVSRNQYRCYEKNQLNKSWASKGMLLPPIYKAEMLANSRTNENGEIVIRYGELPAKFDESDIECNLLVVQKKTMCGYHNFTQINYANWGLLEMGLYRDSLSHDELATQHKEISKTLHFEVPFEKGKVSFSEEEIRPLYDSLELTDYNIKELTIRAYTSVEGSAEKNIEIQNGRAESIVKALQSYQNPEIRYEITARENWVEFLSDVKDSMFNYMIALTKEEIKAELEKSDVADRIEPILADHRKAVITLRLEKKFSDEETNPAVLKTFFDQSVREENIAEAIYIQELIFANIRDENIPSDFIGQLEVPKETQYGALLNNFAIFNYQTDDAFLYENIVNFEELLDFVPDNIKIKYNLTTLKIKARTEGELITSNEDLKKSIDELKEMGLDKSLLRRLMVNYHIILTQHYQNEGNYKEKNKSLKEVYWLYSRLSLNDQDLLSLSKYLAIYSKFDWAEAVIKERVGQVDATEDLIYYYLQLTLWNPKNTKQDGYRVFMLNAIDKDDKRFCDLFLPKPQGGYSFQLLDDEFLRKTYCENCNY